MKRKAPADFVKITVGRTAASRQTPLSPQPSTKASNFSGSYPICSCTNRAPLSTFIRARRTRTCAGGAKGFSTAPMSSSRWCFKDRPER